MSPDRDDLKPMVEPKRARTQHSVPWPIFAVAAFAAALYEAVSHHAPPWALALISVLASLQVAVLAVWVFVLWHNRRIDREAG